MAKFWNSAVYQLRKNERAFKKNCAMILDVWKEFIMKSKKLIMKSFKNCALNLLLGGSKDALIHCFTENSACLSAANRLKWRCKNS